MQSVHTVGHHHSAHKDSIRWQQAADGGRCMGTVHAASQDGAARTATRRRLYQSRQPLAIFGSLDRQPEELEALQGPQGAGVAPWPASGQASVQQATQDDAHNPWLAHGHAAHVAATSALIASSLPVMGLEAQPDALLPNPALPESFAQAASTRSRLATRTGAWFNPLSLPPATLVRAVYGLAKSGQVPSAEWMERCLLACERLFIQQAKPTSTTPHAAVSWPVDAALTAHRSPAGVHLDASAGFPWSPVAQHPGSLAQLDAQEMCMLVWGITRLHQLQQRQQHKIQRHEQHHSTWSPWPQPSQAWVDALCSAVLPMIQQQSSPPSPRSIHPVSSPTTTITTITTGSQLGHASSACSTTSSSSSEAAAQLPSPAHPPPMLIVHPWSAVPWHDQEGSLTHTQQQPQQQQPAVSLSDPGLLESLRHTIHAAGSAQAHAPSPRLCATIPWMFAVLGCQPSPAWCTAWLTASQPLLQHMSGHDVGQMAWAWVRLCAAPPPAAWMAQLMARATQLADARALNPQDLSNLLWACARLGYVPPHTLISTALAPAALKHLTAANPGCKPMDLAQLLWALGKLGVQPEPQSLHHLLCTTLTWKETLSEQDLVNCVWAMAKLGYNPTPAVKRSLVRTVGWRVTCKQLTPRGLPTLLWAFSKLPWKLPDQLSGKLVDIAAAFNRVLTLEGVTLVLFWAAKKRIDMAPWHLAVLMKAVHARDDVSNDTPESDNRDQQQQQYTGEGVRAVQQDVALKYEVARELWARSTPRTAAMLMYAVSKLCYHPSPVWMRQYWAGTLQLLPGASALDLCVMLGGQATLGLRPPRYWLSAVLDRARQLHAAGQLAPEHKSSLSFHFGKWMPSQMKKTTQAAAQTAVVQQLRQQ